MNKKERLVAAIEHGTVIDHIPASKTYQVASLLGLFDLDTPVTIGINYPSQKVGNKGIIKVSDKFFTDDEISRGGTESHSQHHPRLRGGGEENRGDARRDQGYREMQQSEVRHQQRTHGHRVPCHR